MKRPMRVLLIALLLLVVALPAAAQDDIPWDLYLYNDRDMTLLRVAPDGQTEVVALDEADSLIVRGQSITLNADGSLIGYCAEDSATIDAATGHSTQSAVIRQAATWDERLRLDMGTAMDCRVMGFSADGGQAVVSVVRQPPDAGDNVAWEIAVIDLETGETSATLDSGSPLVTPLVTRDPALRATAPRLLAFNTPDEMVFVAVPYGVGGVGQARAYTWNISKGLLTERPDWGNIGFSRLPSSGESAWLTLDPNQATGSPGGPIPAMNTLIIQDTQGDALPALLSGESWVMTHTAFIDGGEALAVGLLASVDAEAAEQPTRWVQFNRDGSVSDIATFSGVSQLMPTEDGFYTLNADYADADLSLPLTITLTRYDSAGASDVWQEMVDTRGVPWQVVWSRPVVGQDALSAFSFDAPVLVSGTVEAPQPSENPGILLDLDGLDADFAFPSGATLSYPSGWELEFNGQVAALYSDDSLVGLWDASGTAQLPGDIVATLLADFGGLNADNPLPDAADVLVQTINGREIATYDYIDSFGDEAVYIIVTFSDGTFGSISGLTYGGELTERDIILQIAASFDLP